MVYFPDAGIYDIIPEFRFPVEQVLTGPDGRNVVWPNTRVPGWMHYHAGVAVQPVHFDPVSPKIGNWDGVSEEEEETVNEDDSMRGVGMFSGVRGVRIIVSLENGEMSWWTVNKRDNEDVGVEGIVL